MTLREIMDAEQPSDEAVRFSDMVVLLCGWRERAQKCRDEAHATTDWENPGTVPNRLLTRAKALDDCAKELEIALQHNDKLSDGAKNK